MGFFDKIKENINHGGVTVSVSTSYVSSIGSDIPVTVSITSTDQRVVNGLNVRLIKRKVVQDNVDTTRTEEEVVDTNNSHGQFSVAPNQTQTINISLNKPFDIDSSANYTVEVSADVEGIALDPTADTRVIL